MSTTQEAVFKEMVISKFGEAYWNHLEVCCDNAEEGFEEDFVSDFDPSLIL